MQQPSRFYVWQSDQKAPVLLVIVMLALLGCGYLALSSLAKMCLEQPIVYTINDPTDANTTWRTDKPLSHAEAVAIGKCPVSLPPEATHIQYVDFYAGYGGFNSHARFEAPVEICRSHARRVLTDYNLRMKANIEVKARPLEQETAQSATSSIQGHPEEAARAAWFDADTMVHGELWGELSSSTPLIFIDTHRGIFYYRRSD